MNLQTKRKKRLVTFMLTTMVLGCLFCACSKDSGSEPEPLALAVNPSDFTFESYSRDSKNLEIKTNGEWKVVYCPNWLSCSSKSGSGNTSITLTTTNENQSYTKSDQIEIMATKDGQETAQHISVTQKGRPDGCYVSIETETAQLIMSYGMACVIQNGNNTSYFYYKIYTNEAYEQIKGNNSQIVQNATKSGTGWTRVNIPSSGGVEICYNECKQNTRYVFVAVPFTANGEYGVIYTNDFMTKQTEEEPLASIIPEPYTVSEEHDGDNGPWYKWEVKKSSGTCKKYYTYACASDTEFETMKNHKGDFGEYNQQDGVNIAWNIWLEHKIDQMTHATSFNKGKGNTREKLFRSYLEGSTQWLKANSMDKYLQIVTWGVDDNENYSGIVTDMIYRVKDGKLIDIVVEPYTKISEDILMFAVSSSTYNISVESNETWTATSNQSWCKVTPAESTNDGPMVISVEQNSDTKRRSAEVTVTGADSGTKLTINVIQDGTDDKPSEEKIIGRDDYDNDKDLN